MTPEEIRKKDRDIHAFLEVFDEPKSFGEGPLSGKTVAIKDNILFEGHKVSAGSKILEGYRATYDATVIKKLKAAGAVIVGRTNCDEFAMGSSTENSAFGPTRNPHDLERVAGGSSGGSAAVVAAGMVDAALGSDTGGSIRQPAALCGVVGLKPTYGRVSRHGLIALASSFDQIGPFSKTVSEAEAVYDVIKGQDSMDSTTISDDTYPRQKKFEKIIGIPKGLNFDISESVKKFESLGYKTQEIDLPNLKYSLSVYYVIVPAEVSSNMARYDGIKYGLSTEGSSLTSLESSNLLDVYKKSRGEGFGPEVRRRIILGTYILSSGYYDAYYGKAMLARKKISIEFENAFDDVDVILTPTTPYPAWKIGEKKSPLENYLADIFTVSANIVGVPAVSLPSGFAEIDGKSLPLGIQLMSADGQEDVLFKIGKSFLGE